MATIVKTEGVLGGKARLDGHRIAVIDVAERVLDHGQAPEHVVDQLDITLPEVYSALAYYYENIEEMNAVRERRRELNETLKRESKAPETVEQ
ncbi:DUF433 domain-containing protein [Halococcus sp. PRR34]|uniref:DUF433 domain-containing protein n=1 Tax=Halococcus TaxID=2249 RepID=UPI002362E04D|nr:DUF433 domain-containing protein [Halococcus sp. PRR34]